MFRKQPDRPVPPRNQYQEWLDTLNKYVDVGELDITEWEKIIGFPQTIDAQREWLQAIRKLIGLTWEDLGAWIDLKTPSVLKYAYKAKDDFRYELSFVQTRFLIYQIREYFRFRDITRTAIPDRFKDTVHHEHRRID